ncbi:CbtB domain-containing protein [Effusibacillus pohliae]|uniref:CbtB domain-containing protein n=1 Tax=Effusibacillus pohliae TaxID=232270 RepID=UPI0003716E1D|nr:CbtB-domain containing protein [Effusibacillus pohliae]
MSTLVQKYVALQTSPAVAKSLYVLQWILLIAWIPVTLYGLFFSPIAALHDAVHPARHGVTIVPCH